MVVALTIREISYLVGLFTIWCTPFRICDTKLFGRAVCFNSAIARKRTLATAKNAFLQWHITYFNRRLLSYFQAKPFPLSPVLQIDAIIVLFSSFLKLGVLSYLPSPLIQIFMLLNEN